MQTKRCLFTWLLVSFLCSCTPPTEEDAPIEPEPDVFVPDPARISELTGELAHHEGESYKVNICAFAGSGNRFLIARVPEEMPVTYKTCGDDLPYSSTFHTANFQILHSLDSSFDGLESLQAKALLSVYNRAWIPDQLGLLALREDEGEWFVTGFFPLQPGDENTPEYITEENDVLSLRWPTHVGDFDQQIKEARQDFQTICPDTVSTALSEQDLHTLVRVLKENCASNDI